MRLFTLGTLIVAGGFLAALPFRRTIGPNDSVDDRSLATGPTTSLADSPGSVSFDPLVVSSPTPTQAMSHALPQRGHSEFAGHQLPGRIPSTAVARPRTRRDIPLTYNDLAVPLQSPHFRDGRYNAMAANANAGRDRAGTDSHDQAPQRPNHIQSSPGSLGDFVKFQPSLSTEPTVDSSPAGIAADARSHWERESGATASVLAAPPGNATPMMRPRLEMVTKSKPEQPVAMVGSRSVPSDRSRYDASISGNQRRQRQWIRQPD